MSIYNNDDDDNNNDKVLLTVYNNNNVYSSICLVHFLNFVLDIFSFSLYLPVCCHSQQKIKLQFNLILN